MTPIASVKTKVSLGSLRTHQSYIDECQDISRFITINLIYCFKEMCGKSQNLIFFVIVFICKCKLRSVAWSVVWYLYVKLNQMKYSVTKTLKKSYVGVQFQNSWNITLRFGFWMLKKLKIPLVINTIN